MPTRYKIQGAPELASRLRRALDQQDISGGELELTFSPEVLVKDASVPPYVQDPVYWASGPVVAAVVGEFSHAGVVFNGPGLAVIDQILVGTPTAAQWFVRFGRNLAALTALATVVHDRADLRGIGVDTVALTAVQNIIDSDAAAQGTILMSGVNPAGATFLIPECNIVMAAGDMVFCVPAAANVAINVTMMGRWFPNAIQS